MVRGCEKFHVYNVRLAQKDYGVITIKNHLVLVPQTRSKLEALHRLCLHVPECVSNLVDFGEARRQKLRIKNHSIIFQTVSGVKFQTDFPGFR